MKIPVSRNKNLLNLFQVETDERIQKITTGLLSLSDDPGDKEVLRNISREAHTLKGSSRMLGFFDISEIAHKMENLLFVLKEEKLEFSVSLSEVLSEGLESIRTLTQDKLSDKKSKIDVKEICSKIEKAYGLDQQPEKEEVFDFLHWMYKHLPEKKDTAEVRMDTVKKSIVSMPEIGNTIRVNISKLDKLVNLAGELETSRIKFEERRKNFATVSKALVKKMKLWTEIKEKFFSIKSTNKFFTDLENDIASYNRINEQIDNITDFAKHYGDDISQISIYLRELYSLSMEMRMLPVSILFNLFPYTAKQLAIEYGKKINLKITGETTKLDKKIIDGIKDPILHLVRNAIAHGIEPVRKRAVLNKPENGTIQLNAYQEGNSIYIEINDDGSGINPEKIKKKAIESGLLNKKEARNLNEQEIISFIFKPGFSTDREVNQISGRGIGMDVVKNDVENLGGKIKVESNIGKGTKIILQIPITLVTANALLIELNGQTYAIPDSAVDTAIKVTPDKFKVKKNETTILLNKKPIPVYRLKEILQMDKEHNLYDKKIPVVVIRHAQEKVGFIVDEFIETREIMIKKLGKYLSRIRYFSGATILPKGEMALILHIPYLMDSVKKQRAGPKLKVKEKKPYSILIVDDAVTTRELVKQILEAEGYKTDMAVDGQDALDKINTGNYDLIIADILMPRLDGLQMIRELKNSENYKSIPVIIVSTLQHEEDKKKGMEAGASAYFMKSEFNQLNLLNTIQRLISVI